MPSRSATDQRRKAKESCSRSEDLNLTNQQKPQSKSRARKHCAARRSHVFVFVADHNVDTLGFKTSGKPPQKMFVSSVKAGGWADSKRIMTHDEVLALDNQEVSGITLDDLKRLIRKRPLEIAIRFQDTDREEAPRSKRTAMEQLHKSPQGADFWTVVVDEGIDHLGFGPSAMPPERVYLLGVEEGSWAESAGLFDGIELISIDGIDVSEISAKEFKKMLKKKRPLELGFQVEPELDEASDASLQRMVGQIYDGTVLMCNHDEEDMVIYASPDSQEVIGHFSEGQKVEASGQAEYQGGVWMVPIKPQGAVELELFVVFEADGVNPEEKHKKDFRKRDGDGLGFISAAELAATAEGLTEEDAAYLIEQVDEDGDGQLNEEEYVQMMMTHAKTLRDFEATQEPSTRTTVEGNARTSTQVSDASLQRMVVEVNDGTVLMCTHDEHDMVIYASPESQEVMGHFSLGEKVEASGQAQFQDGIWMLPIKPQGAVELELFEIFRPQAEARRKSQTSTQASQEMLQRMVGVISDGTVLICSHDEHDTVIYESPESQEVIGQLSLGDKVEASGQAQNHGGVWMVPIKPQGAVELELCEISLPDVGAHRNSGRRSQASQEPPSQMVEQGQAGQSTQASDDALQQMVAQINDGSVLVCTSDEHDLVIYESFNSYKITGHLSLGEKVEAAGQAEHKNGTWMVPIKPHGAVELELFEIFRPDIHAERKSRTSTEASDASLQRKVGEIDRGTLLMCAHDEHDLVIYESTMSHEVIGNFSLGEKVEASGAAQFQDGVWMVPIKPEGAVELELFEIFRPGMHAKRESRTSSHDSNASLQRKVGEIHDGTLLACAHDDHDMVVYASTESHEVIGHFSLGEKVEASGQAQHQDGVWMVPIKPRGAVELELFEVFRTQMETHRRSRTSSQASQQTLQRMVGEINSGTLLMCAHDEHDMVIYSSSVSHEVIGHFYLGEKVEASGQAQYQDGIWMVPIKPQGAVELELFEIFRATPRNSAQSDVRLQWMIGKIDDGTVLTCTHDESDMVIYASLDAHNVIGHFSMGEKVEACGRAQHHNVWMVPIKPRGAVELALFEILGADVEPDMKPKERAMMSGNMDENYGDSWEEPDGWISERGKAQISTETMDDALQQSIMQISDGTLLSCIHDENDTAIYAALDSHEVIGQISFGEKVEASGQAHYQDGVWMVPIKPEGVVELELFEIFDAEIEPNLEPEEQPEARERIDENDGASWEATPTWMDEAGAAELDVKPEERSMVSGQIDQNEDADAGGDDDVWTVVAEENDTALGCQIAGQPPDDRLFIIGVQAGSWAELQGLYEGLELIAINGKSVSDLTLKKFEKVMRKRPLELTLLADAKDTFLTHDEDAEASRSELNVDGKVGEVDPAPSTAEGFDIEKETSWESNEAAQAHLEESNAAASKRKVSAGRLSSTSGVKRQSRLLAPGSYKMTVSIIGAKSLGVGDEALGSSDPYCSCRLVGKADTTVHTPVLRKTLKPKWNYTAEINGFDPQDYLEFEVYDIDLNPKALKEELLGKVVLPPPEFFPDGYDGELRLLDPHGIASKQRLRVKVELQSAPVLKEPVSGKFDYVVLDPRGVQVYRTPRIDMRERLAEGPLLQGHLAAVVEKRCSNEGIEFLRLAEPRGWVADIKSSTGLSSRMEQVTREFGSWRYRVARDDGATFHSRLTTNAEAETGGGLRAGAMVVVTERVKVRDITFLKVVSKGWLFDIGHFGVRIMKGPLEEWGTKASEGMEGEAIKRRQEQLQIEMEAKVELQQRREEERKQTEELQREQLWQWERQQQQELLDAQRFHHEVQNFQLGQEVDQLQQKWERYDEEVSELHHHSAMQRYEEASHLFEAEQRGEDPYSYINTAGDRIVSSPRHKEESHREEQSSSVVSPVTQVMTPSRFQAAYRNVKCHIIVCNAVNLAGGSMFDKLDPYAVVRFRGSKDQMKTSVLDDAGSDPVWNSEGSLMYQGETALEISVWDRDKYSAHGLIATGVLQLEQFFGGFEGTVPLNLPEGKKRKAKMKQMTISLDIQWDSPKSLPRDLPRDSPRDSLRDSMRDSPRDPGAPMEVRTLRTPPVETVISDPVLAARVQDTMAAVANLSGGKDMQEAPERSKKGKRRQHDHEHHERDSSEHGAELKPREEPGWSGLSNKLEDMDSAVDRLHWGPTVSGADTPLQRPKVDAVKTTREDEEAATALDIPGGLMGFQVRKLASNLAGVCAGVFYWAAEADFSGQMRLQLLDVLLHHLRPCSHYDSGLTALWKDLEIEHARLTGQEWEAPENVPEEWKPALIEQLPRNKHKRIPKKKKGHDSLFLFDDPVLCSLLSWKKEEHGQSKDDVSSDEGAHWETEQQEEAEVMEHYGRRGRAANLGELDGEPAEWDVDYEQEGADEVPESPTFGFHSPQTKKTRRNLPDAEPGGYARERADFVRRTPSPPSRQRNQQEAEPVL